MPIHPTSFREAARDAILRAIPPDNVISATLLDVTIDIVSNWMADASMMAQNADFYRRLLDQCAENLGPLRDQAFTADDGTKYDSPIRLKLPTLIAKLVDVIEGKDEVPAAHPGWNMEDAAQAVLGGVGEISPAHFRASLERIAVMCDRKLDNSLRDDVRRVLRTHFADLELDADLNIETPPDAFEPLDDISLSPFGRSMNTGAVGQVRTDIPESSPDHSTKPVYKRLTRYQFTVCGELINITDLDPDYVWVEEARKNGHEDCHMAGELQRSHDGTFVWVEGEHKFIDYGSQELADGIRNYINTHGLPR